MRKLVKTALIPITLITLIGCSDTNVKTIKSLSLEEVSGTRLANLTQNEKDGVIFKYLTNSTIVDNTNLISIDNDDFKRIEVLLNGIHGTLKGSNTKDIDGKPFISDNLSNYILFEMVKTPYEWRHKSTTPIGYDASTGMYFVDVNYETVDKLKYVIPSSTIPEGLDGGEIVKEKRYNDYITYLNSTIKGDVINSKAYFESFKKNWGSIDLIIEEQDTLSLIERVRKKPTKNIGGLTYTGVIQNPKMTQHADMTIRYILNYKYNLGEETTIGVSKVYLKDYKLRDTEELIVGQNAETIENLKVLEPYIKRTINSYEKAVAENNHTGLFSLHENYNMFDKYFDSLNTYLYNWSSSFNFKILGKNGTDLLILIEKEKQYRGKHTDMSMPTYHETNLMTLVMSDDDKLRVKNNYLLSSELVGEPNTVIKNITGVSDNITYDGNSFSNENMEKVETKVKEFLQLVFINDTNSENFTNVVDIGVSQNTLLNIHNNMTSVTDAKSKLNYMTWKTKSNIYASVDVRELFIKSDHNLDTRATIDLVNRNGDWYVINYVRTLSVKTKSGNVLNTKNILSENTKDGSVDRKEMDNTVEDNTPVEVIKEDELDTVEETKPITNTNNQGDTSNKSNSGNSGENPIDSQTTETSEATVESDTTTEDVEVEDTGDTSYSFD